MKKTTTAIITWVAIIAIGSLMGKACGMMSAAQRNGVYNGTLTTSAITDADIDTELNQLIQNNDVYRLMVEHNPSLKKELHADIKKMMSNPQVYAEYKAPQHGLHIQDINLPSLQKEFGKYLILAPSQNVYDSYYVESKHVKERGNCIVYPLPEKQRLETMEVKSKLIQAAIKNPVKFTPLSDEKFEKILEKVFLQYKKKGYNVNHILILTGAKPGKLTKEEECMVTTHLSEAALSLPRKESIPFLKTVVWMSMQ